MTRRYGSLLTFAALLPGCMQGPARQALRPAEMPVAQPAPLVPGTTPGSNYHLLADRPERPTTVSAADATDPSDHPAGPRQGPPLRQYLRMANDPTGAQAADATMTVLPVAAAVTDSPRPPPDPPLVSALRFLLDHQPKAAAEALRQLDPTMQDLVLSLVGLAQKAAEGGLDRTAPHEASVLLEQLGQIADLLRGRAPLVLDNLCFCRKIEGFGVYDPLPGDHTFQSGGDGQPGERVQVYVEVRNFLTHSANALHETNLGSRLEVRDFERGNVVYRMDFPAVVDRSRTPRRDYFINFQFHVPANLPAGSYTLWVQVQDNLSPPGGPHRVSRRSLDFHVRSGTPR
jgi:hypothetical protein